MLSMGDIQKWCLNKNGACEDYPFGPGVVVYKVGGKMFALLAFDDERVRLNLKCHPDLAVALRAAYPAIVPGYHMNKQHWNSLLLAQFLEDDLVYWLIDHSFDLVFAGLPRTRRMNLNQDRQGAGPYMTVRDRN